MIAAVEAWRGIAALLVVWTHWGPPLGWPMGPMRFAFTGVDLFFVLSGFVFAPVVLGGRSIALVPYALRRLLRIYPAYLVALALYAALAWQSGRPLLYLPEHLLMAHLQSREMTFYYNPVFWSLPSELEFYALVPLLAWVLALGGGRGWPLLVGAALATRLMLLALADGATQNFAYLALHHLPGLLVEFLLGAWVWRAARRHPLSARSALGLGVAGMLGWLACAWLFARLESWSGAPDWRHGQLSLVAAASFALLLWASLRLPAPADGSWSARAARGAGRMSYPLYLLHIAWMVPAQAWSARWGSTLGSLAGLLALGLSCWAMNVLVEEPARRWGRRLSQRWASGGSGHGGRASRMAAEARRERGR